MLTILLLTYLFTDYDIHRLWDARRTDLNANKGTTDAWRYVIVYIDYSAIIVSTLYVNIISIVFLVV